MGLLRDCEVFSKLRLKLYLTTSYISVTWRHDTGTDNNTRWNLRNLCPPSSLIGVINIVSLYYPFIHSYQQLFFDAPSFTSSF